MRFVKIDVGYWSHPKMVDGGLAATGLDVRAMCWSAHHGTDGFVPFTVLSQLGAGHHRLQPVIDRLIEVGRWRRVEGGYQVHDYLDWQTSAARQREVSELRSRAGRIGGSKQPSNEQAKGQAEYRSRTNHSSSSDLRLGPNRPDDDDEDQSASQRATQPPDLLVRSAVAVLGDRHLAARCADVGPVGNPAGWLEADRKATASRHEARALHVALARPELTPPQLADLLEPPASNGTRADALDASAAAAAERRERVDQDRAEPCQTCDSTGWVEADEGMVACPDCDRVSVS